jgi:hypothetical protein
MADEVRATGIGWLEVSNLKWHTRDAVWQGVSV